MKLLWKNTVYNMMKKNQTTFVNLNIVTGADPDIPFWCGKIMKEINQYFKENQNFELNKKKFQI